MVMTRKEFLTLPMSERRRIMRKQTEEYMKAEREENKSWRCFHCDKIFTDYEEARKHFGNIPTAMPLCILEKCLCLECINYSKCKKEER